MQLRGQGPRPARNSENRRQLAHDDVHGDPGEKAGCHRNGQQNMPRETVVPMLAG